MGLMGRPTFNLTYQWNMSCFFLKEFCHENTFKHPISHCHVELPEGRSTFIVTFDPPDKGMG